MEKLINLIEQVRFAELEKIDRLSKAQELNPNNQDQFNQESIN